MKKKRVHFDFTRAAAARLDELVGITGSSSRAELVRRALALYDEVWAATRNREQTLVFRSKKDGTEREVIFL